MKFNIKVDLQSFDVEVSDIHERPVRVTVDGETFEVWPETAEAVPAGSTAAVVPNLIQPPAAQGSVPSAPGMAQPAGDRARTVAAPIPGVILSVSVKVGDAVAFGQELCVLEAMKMKNLIRANRAGKIAAIHIDTGDQVRHSQVLMEYAD